MACFAPKMACVVQTRPILVFPFSATGISAIRASTSCFSLVCVACRESSAVSALWFIAITRSNLSILNDTPTLSKPILKFSLTLTLLCCEEWQRRLRKPDPIPLGAYPPNIHRNQAAGLNSCRDFPLSFPLGLSKACHQGAYLASSLCIDDLHHLDMVRGKK